MAARAPPEEQATPSLEPTEDVTVRRAAPPGFIHLGVAKEIYPVLREFGAAAEQIIEEADLDPRLFEHPDNLIPIGTLGRLLLLCAEKTGCPYFGLLVGQRSQLRSLRAVGALMRCSDSFGDALKGMNAHLRVQNRSAVTQLEIDGDLAVFSFSLYDPSGVGAAQIIDGALATTVQVFRELCGPEFTLSEVLIPRRQPEEIGPYRNLFRAPVRFNQDSAVLVFPARWPPFKTAADRDNPPALPCSPSPLS